MSNDSRIHSFHPEHYGDLKSAVRALLHACGGEVKAASACRVSKSTLSEYGNPAHDNRQIPVDVALSLEQSSGSLPVTEHLAAEHGCILLRLPDSDAEPVWIEHLAAIGREAGDVFSRTGEYLANDGDIDDQEAPHLLRELDELLAATASMRAAVRARIRRND